MATSPDPPGEAAAPDAGDPAAAAPGPLLSRPTLALLVAGLAFLIVVLAGEWSYQKAVRSLDSLGDRTAARAAIQSVVRNVLEAEAAQRGFLLTGNEVYLEPMRNVRADLTFSMERLRTHYAQDAQLTQALQGLVRTAEDKLSEVDETLRLHRMGSHEAWQALTATDFGRERMNQVREAAVRLLETEDERVLAERAEVYTTLWLGRAGIVGATLLAALWLVFYVRHSTARHALERAHAADLRAQRDALEAKVKMRTAELSQLNRYLQDVREVERGRLARILHDELGSLLTAAKLDLTRLRRALGDGSAGAVARLDHLVTTIDQGIGLKRRIIEELMPSALINLGLVPALEMLCADVERRTDLKVSVDVQEVLLDDAGRITLYRVVEAALSNVEMHAEATNVAVQVGQADHRVRVTVRDDGCGFEDLPQSGPTHQLTLLRHRVESLQGRLQISSAPSRGTEIVAELPAADGLPAVADPPTVGVAPQATPAGRRG